MNKIDPNSDQIDADIVDAEPVDSSKEQHRRVLIFGPHGAGKTCLIGGLELCADAGGYQVGDSIFDVLPGNEKMLQMSENARDIVEDHEVMPIPNTEHVTHYEFTLTERPADPQNGQNKMTKYRFEVADSRGGMLFDGCSPKHHDYQRIRESDEFKNFVEFGHKADGVILCVDAGTKGMTDEEYPDGGPTRLFFRQLSLVMQHLTDGGKVPFEKIVVVLTKADKYFLLDDKSAEQEALDTNPWARAEEVISDIGLYGMLKWRGENPKVVCTWSSLYGFVRGRSNWDVKRKRLLTQVSSEENATTAYSQWKPFRLLSPFIFFAKGEADGLVPYEDWQLEKASK